VPAPRTALHAVDARIKQVWTIAVLIILSRASMAVKLGIAAGARPSLG
jgi:hypothetical protein